MSAYYSPNTIRRLHQLHGTNGIAQALSLGGQLNFKFDDLPQTMTALGRKLINYVGAIRLNFSGTLTSTGGAIIPKKVLTPMLIASVQIQGTELGSPVSSSHMLGGIIDTDSYIRKGCRDDLFNSPGISLGANAPKTFNYTVDIVLGHFGQAKGHQTCPLALFLQPGEIMVNLPTNLAAVDTTLSDVTLAGVGGPTGGQPMKCTAHAVLIPSTEILIANPWQLTRHKAVVGANTDSIQISSFGNASTLTGVQSKCGIGALLWASDSLIGPAKGSGSVSSITQFAADFLGLRQNNDPRAIVQQMFAELSDGQTLPYGGLTEDHSNPLYPMFDLQASGGVYQDFDLMASAEFFPIISPMKFFEASKLFEAVGNPSYDLTGNFTGSAHYTYMEGCYPFSMDQLNSLLAVIQRSHLGLELYQTDDLILSTKTSDNSDPMALIASPEKLVYLPRVVIPRSNPAVK
jgi:hypothetical protein